MRLVSIAIVAVCSLGVTAAKAQSDADRRTCEAIPTNYRYDQAFIDTCTRAIAAAGDAQLKSQLLTRRAVGYRMLNQYNRALPDNDAAVGAAPQLAVAYAERAMTYFLLRKLDLALRDCEKSLQLDGRVSQAARECGLYHEVAGHNDRALALLDQALQLDPTSGDNLLARCSLRRRMGRPSEALEDCNRHLARKPDIFFTLSERSMIYLQMGKLAGAKADAEAAQKKGKVMIFINDRLAKVLTATGDAKAAARAAQQGEISTNQVYAAMLGIDPDQERKP
jgi:tetratricopeptide (TPR) repeat protein